MKIALSGYYGFDNAGDEALLSAICRSIQQLEPQAEFVIFSGFPERTTQMHGLRAVNRMNPWQLIRELLTSNLLISGGGSLLQDVTGPRSLPYYISIVALAKTLGKPVIFYAQGIGPINRNFSKWLMRIIANKVDLITLRDEDSLLLLQELGINRPPIKLTADPVFALEPSGSDLLKTANIIKELGLEPQKLVGVSVRPWSALEGYQPNLARVLDALVQKGYQVIFIPMDYARDWPESQRVLALMEEKGHIVQQHLSSMEHLALLSGFDLLVGMRLHSLIFAANRGVPFAGIAYDPKIVAFLKSFGLNPLPESSSAMLLELERLLESPGLSEHISSRVRDLRLRAEENAALALSLIR
ncbi:MAG: polysaccharide pyruvyl transferase CsaB [Syntrophomonadaceae bacterium]|jgi:polysaccharide pyruvyl transferase CsaB|nr:polysaccharide pyruvyl transferase CsaB [Syntrophomonadaceae bacterium]